jgi:hypothetical protein
VNQGGSIMSANEIPKTILQKDYYPDPQTIPLPPSPSQRQPIPLVTLSELIPGKYVSTTARIVYIKTIEKQDALGSKIIFSGILEDSTFKVPFISHRISYPMIRNSIYKFNSAYAHEFPADKSLLLIITEHTRIDSKNVEDYRDFIWNPKIESIKRPVRSVSLNGIITTVHNNSGLIKRCNKCKSIIYDSCPNKCSQQEGWGWDLRVSSRLYDGSGSIKMVLTKDIASRVLHRNLSELILLASQDKPLTQTLQQPASVLKIKIPESIEIIEAVTENTSSSSYRSNGKLIVTDGRNLVFLPPELGEEETYKFSEHVKRPLKPSDLEDRKIIKKLIEKALDISIKKVTGMRMMQGIYLLEEPISLYRCERAKLYLGFSVRLSLIGEDNGLTVEATPQAYVRESVLDFVKLRRERGATANAVVRNLLTYRNKVIVAPSGNYGCIVDVVTKKAGNQQVSETDNRNLVEFWKQVYGIEISPDEIPLLKVKMMNSENVFTYPPSMCFFGSESLLIYANVQKFIENKKYSLEAKVEDVIRNAVQQQDLQIGSAELKVEEFAASRQSDVQSQLLQEIRLKMFGRNATARGSIMFVHDELWFFPNQIQFS